MRKVFKLSAALLMGTALWMPTQAAAGPVAPFFVGFLGGAGGYVVGTFAANLFIAGSFLGQSIIGNILLNIGVSYLAAARNKPKAPTIEDARVNSRIADATRWIMGGISAVGGTAGPFLEFDADGNFWYIMAHGDAELVGEPTYLLDGIQVELSDGTDDFEAGDVLTDAFCLTTGGDQYEGDGEKDPVWRIYTVTPDVDNVYGALPTAFTDAFVNLPSDFYGAGVCYSIIRGRALAPQKRGNGYRWRGPIGVGEPSVSIVGNFERMYDPRNPAHDVDDKDTWTASDGNPAIVFAWFRTNPRGRGQAMSSINWTLIAEWADIFDQTVLDRSGDPVPLYRVGVAFPDNKPRVECEADILAACDGFAAYDDEGKVYLVGGYYQEPTLTINAARDVYTSQTQTVDDGEAPMDGVVVEYTSPEHGYTKQTSAPWVNTLHYDGVSEPNYMKFPVLGCQNHNQAVRLAKAFGLREQPARRAAYGTTIKGLLAKNRRGINLEHDARFSGPFEIVTPVQEDSSGQFCRFAVVPMQEDRWYLNEGEEGVPPAPTPLLDIDNELEVAENVDVAAVTILTNTGAAVRLEATFDAPGRVDRFFRFRLAPTVGFFPGRYEDFTTDMDLQFAYSNVVTEGQDYEVSWQTITAGGRATVWSNERDVPESITIEAIATDLPGDLSDVTPFAEVGRVRFTGTGPVRANFRGVKIYRGTTSDFADAVAVSEIIEAIPGDSFDVAAGGTGVNLVTGGGFDGSGTWTSSPGGIWSQASGKAVHDGSANASFKQAVSGLTSGQSYRWGVTVEDNDGAGALFVQVQGASNASATAGAANGRYTGTLTALAGPTDIALFAGAAFNAKADGLEVFVPTVGDLAQGAANFWIVPVSMSFEEGAPDGPHALIIT